MWSKLKAMIWQIAQFIVMLANKNKIAKKKKIMPLNGADIINKAKNHLFKANILPGKEIPSASLRWSEYLGRIRSDIDTLTTIDDAIYYAQNMVGFDHRVHAAVVMRYFSLYEELLKNEFSHFSHDIEKVGDSPYSDPYTIATYKGRLVSNVFYYHFRYLLFCLTFIHEPKIVCEIGGGYGGPARLWLENSIHRPNTYVIIDFPECLFFAEVFLKANLCGHKFLYVTDPNQLDPLMVEKYSVIFCPISLISALTNLSMDLVINTGSMQEMTEEWIDFWMEWLKNQNCRYFYSSNYFAQPLSFMAEGANTWAPRLTSDWIVRLQSFNPTFIKLHSDRNVGEILAEKPLIRSDPNKEMLANIYNSQRKRILNGQMLLEAMDIIRINPNQEIVWNLLNRCLSEMLTIPKEAQWLSNYLNNHADNFFMERNEKQLRNIIDKLNYIRFTGKENIY